MRALRRLALLLVVAAVVSVVLARRRRDLPSVEHPVWPALDVELPATPAEPAIATVTADAARWVVSTNGEIPAGYPVKVNTASGIFHVPGGRSYARTKPDRCYATPADAEADGFRQAKL